MEICRRVQHNAMTRGTTEPHLRNWRAFSVLLLKLWFFCGYNPRETRRFDLFEPLLFFLFFFAVFLGRNGKSKTENGNEGEEDKCTRWSPVGLELWERKQRERERGDFGEFLSESNMLLWRKRRRLGNEKMAVSFVCLKSKWMTRTMTGFFIFFFKLESNVMQTWILLSLSEAEKNVKI